METRRLTTSALSEIPAMLRLPLPCLLALSASHALPPHLAAAQETVQLVEAGGGDLAAATWFGACVETLHNGTLVHELHGREDDRSRTFIFVQMLLLATLAVFAGEAAGDGGAFLCLRKCRLHSVHLVPVRRAYPTSVFVLLWQSAGKVSRRGIKW